MWKLIVSFLLDFLAALFLILRISLLFRAGVAHLQGSLFIWVFPFLRLGNLEFDFPILLDVFSIIFRLTVSLITIAVINFTKGYIEKEKFLLRFLNILLLFVLSIYLLIFCNSLFFLMLGWDGLGVVSYLLVIYFFSKKSNNAGILTILTNRIGDVCLILVIRARVSESRWRIALNPSNQLNILLRATLFLGAFTKRAQIPFSAWLPAAIAAPTPVSSLVHSSTLVTAGVYILFRFGSVCDLKYAVYFGLFTILMAGLAALKETDIKKIVALSTLRQLGFMVFSLTTLRSGFRFFHLLLHAYFKALLFISVGNIIHLSDDYQDLRKLNFFEAPQALTLTAALFANISLMGFPFIRGFFSKDLILEDFFNNYNLNLTVRGIIYLNCVLTGIYSVRLIYFIFLSPLVSKSRVIKYLEDYNFILGARVLLRLTLMSANGLFWLLIPSNKILFLRVKWKCLLSLIFRVRVILSWALMQNHVWGSPSWAQGQIWGLPFFSASLVKRKTLQQRVILSNLTDQALNQRAHSFTYWGAKENGIRDSGQLWNYKINLLLILGLWFY